MRLSTNWICSNWGLPVRYTRVKARPPYAPGVLLKLYLYGYLNKIRSSRKLEKECSRNIELQWLLQNLSPNYHTIADFRKLHAHALQNMFRLYVQFLADAGLLGKTTTGIDGSKFKMMMFQCPGLCIIELMCIKSLTWSNAIIIITKPLTMSIE